MTTDWNKLKVVDLRAELKKRGLAQAGVKQELVNRLVSADAEDAKERSSEEGPIQAEPPQPSDDSNAGAGSNSEPSVEPSKDDGGDTQMMEDNEPNAAATDAPPKENDALTATPPMPTLEALVDEKKRKRRSSSPPPTNHRDTPRKRPRQEAESPLQTDGVDATSDTGTKSSNKVEDVVSNPGERPAVEARQEPARTAPSSDPQPSQARAGSVPRMEQDDVVDYGADSPNAHLEPEPEPRSESKLADIKQAEVIRTDAAPTLETPQQDDSQMLINTDSAGPSLHSVTDSLYIGNFMRPLRTENLRGHLVNLSAQPGNDPDPLVIVAFWLDPIRTHALVRFKSVAAAVRVRAALHDKVWPNESNRKALWVDYVPSSEIEDWIEKEQSRGDKDQKGGGRRGAIRWEVVYRTEGGATIAKHQEAASDAKGMAPPPLPTASRATPAIPTGPANKYPGIEAAPSGPRSMVQSNRAEGRGDMRDIRANNYERTRVSPSLSWQTVSSELARRRLDNLNSFVPQDPNREVGTDCHRYSFTHSDQFIDRGPEMFKGIRPPHRERERRRLSLPGDAPGSAGRETRGVNSVVARPSAGSYRPPIPAPVWEPPPPPHPRRRHRRGPGGGGASRGGNARFGEGGRFGDGRPPRYEDFRYRPGENDHRSDRR